MVVGEIFTFKFWNFDEASEAPVAVAVVPVVDATIKLIDYWIPYAIITILCLSLSLTQLWLNEFDWTLEFDKFKNLGMPDVIKLTKPGTNLLIYKFILLYFQLPTNFYISTFSKLQSDFWNYLILPYFNFGDMCTWNLEF